MARTRTAGRPRLLLWVVGTLAACALLPQPAAAVWPGANGKIVTAEDRTGGGDFNLYLYNYDGSGETPLTTGSAVDRFPEFNPAGNTVVFARDGNIWKLDLGSHAQRARAAPTSSIVAATHDPPIQLTDNGDAEAVPTFSPDSTKIFYTRTLGADTQLWRMNGDGSGEEQVPGSPNGLASPEGLPGGQGPNPVILVAASGQNLFLLAVDGTSSTVPTPTQPAVVCTTPGGDACYTDLFADQYKCTASSGFSTCNFDFEQACNALTGGCLELQYSADGSVGIAVGHSGSNDTLNICSQTSCGPPIATANTLEFSPGPAPAGGGDQQCRTDLVLEEFKLLDPRGPFGEVDIWDGVPGSGGGLVAAVPGTYNVEFRYRNKGPGGSTARLFAGNDKGSITGTPVQVGTGLAPVGRSVTVKLPYEVDSVHEPSPAYVEPEGCTEINTEDNASETKAFEVIEDLPTFRARNTGLLFEGVPFLGGRIHLTFAQGARLVSSGVGGGGNIIGAAVDADPEALSRLVKAEFAILRLQPGIKAAAKKKSRCLWLSKSTGRFKASNPKAKKCLDPIWLKAKKNKKKKGTWTADVLLPEGKYVLYARATNAAGLSHRLFNKKIGNRLAFTVKTPKKRR